MSKERTDIDYDFESYLINAMIHAIVEAGGIPEITVRTINLQGNIDQKYRENGMIVLNVSANAAPDMTVSGGMVMLTTRFHGRSQQLAFPSEDVIAVHDRVTRCGRVIISMPHTRAPEAPDPRDRRPLIRPGQLAPPGVVVSEVAPVEAIETEITMTPEPPAPVSDSSNVHKVDFTRRNKRD